MREKSFFLGLFLIVLSLGLSFGAGGRAGATGLLPNRTEVLPNGLTVILHEDHRAPFIAILVRYRAGARHEAGGPSGIAHLLEHLLFRGSDHLGRLDQHVLLYQLGSREFNAATRLESTDYYEVIPAGNLETALWMESDRMGFPNLDWQSLSREREIVQSERRERQEGAPYAKGQLLLWQALFPAGHPYHHNIIGSPEDLASLGGGQIKSFFARYYAPSNATLVLSGDFQTDQVLPLVKKYFGSLRSQPPPTPPAIAAPQLTREVVLNHTERIGKSARLRVAWLTPPILSKLDAAADLLCLVLSRGRLGRLREKLQESSSAVQSIRVQQQSNTGESVFTVSIDAADAAMLPALLKGLDESLAEIARDGIPEEEMTTVRRWMRGQRFEELEDLRAKAHRLAIYHEHKGRADWMLLDLVRYQTVTSKDIQELVREHLRPDRRVVLHVTPALQNGGAK